MAPRIAGIVLGRVLDDNFTLSMLKSQDELGAFFDRPVAAVPGVVTFTLRASSSRGRCAITRGMDATRQPELEDGP